MTLETVGARVENRTNKRSAAEVDEMFALGIVDENGIRQVVPQSVSASNSTKIARGRMEAHDVLNEAYHYAKPASFSRGLRIPLGNVDLLLISGTASVDEEGKSIHLGDFRAQCWRTYRNITHLLQGEGATWQDIVRCSCYLRDIERDYDDFNEVRAEFFTWLGLDPLPASTGIQARLCREDLLVEIEAIAIIPNNRVQNQS